MRAFAFGANGVAAGTMGLQQGFAARYCIGTGVCGQQNKKGKGSNFPHRCRLRGPRQHTLMQINQDSINPPSTKVPPALPFLNGSAGMVRTGLTIGRRMFSLLTNIGPEIPLALLLMGLLGLRTKVWPRASLYVAASPEKLFELIDVAHGKLEDWGRTTTRTEMLDPARQYFRKTYSTTLASGIVKSFSADFSVRARNQPHRIEIQREGLEGKSLNNELLSQVYEVTAEGKGARLTTVYEWGPRPLLALLTARADLLGGAYRLKGLAEKGIPDNRPYQFISAAVAAATGAISLVAFALMLDWVTSALLIVALAIHEFGHLLAYRLIGQPWGRMIFLPFLGAVALPRLPFDSQGQSVFSALMGPGFSILFAAACTAHVIWTPNHEVIPMLVALGMITTFLNIFNLLPVEPLDGGVALRSVLGRMMGRHARFGLMAVGLAIAATGIVMSQMVLVIFGGLAVLFNFKDRKIDAGLAPLPRLQLSISAFAYISLVAAYVTLLRFYLELLTMLRSTA
jgi:Zn-dependent protease